MHQKPVFYLSFASDVQDALPALRAERQDVHEILRKHAFLEVQQEADTDKKVLFGAFNDYRGRIAVFHYGGHAGKDILRLEDTDLQGKTLLTLIEEEIKANPESLALVFLNGCATESQKDALLKAGVRCVIGTVRHIDDTVAQQFAVKFYEAWAGKGDITVRSAYRIAQAFLTNEPENQHIRFVEKTGSENDTQTGEFAWGLYESAEGVADTITLKSIEKSYQDRTPHVFYADAELQGFSTIFLPAKKSFSIYRQAQKALSSQAVIDYLAEKAKQPQYLQIITIASETWTPFQNETILELLKEFAEKSKLGLHLVFVQSWDVTQQLHRNKIKGTLGRQTIFILHKNAIENPANQHLIKCIDESQGGLLAPLAEAVDWEKALPTAYTNWRKTFDEPFMFIDLGVIDKEILFRRLTDIAHYHITKSKTILTKINVNE